MSHAVCVRGLKLLNLGETRQRILVARRVRAWIETIYFMLPEYFCNVARRVRAWIETFKRLSGTTTFWSHAVCVRGLKHETTIKHKDFLMSHAVCVRGLKHYQG